MYLELINSHQHPTSMKRDLKDWKADMLYMLYFGFKLPQTHSGVNTLTRRG